MLLLLCALLPPLFVCVVTLHCGQEDCGAAGSAEGIWSAASHVSQFLVQLTSDDKVGQSGINKEKILSDGRVLHLKSYGSKLRF